MFPLSRGRQAEDPVQRFFSYGAGKGVSSFQANAFLLCISQDAE